MMSWNINKINILIYKVWKEYLIFFFCEGEDKYFNLLKYLGKIFLYTLTNVSILLQYAYDLSQNQHIV